MNARPKAASSLQEKLRAQQAGPGNQADCQAKIEKARRKRTGTIDRLNGYVLDFNKLVFKCEGYEAVGGHFGVALPSTLTGTEPPHWRMEDFGRHKRLKVLLGARIEGMSSTASEFPIGLEIIGGGKGFMLGGFAEGTDALGNSNIALSFRPWDYKVGTDDVVATSEPWVMVRLDDGTLYMGQFGGGGPNGFGWHLRDGMRAGRMGFFADGRPEGVGIEWETKIVRVHRDGESETETLRAAIDHVKLVYYRNGEYSSDRWLQRGADGWKIVDREAWAQEGNFVAQRKEKENQERRRREAEQKAREELLASLKAGDFVDTLDGACLVLAGPDEYGVARAFGASDTVSAGLHLRRVEPGTWVQMKGRPRGLTVGSPEAEAFAQRKIAEHRAWVAGKAAREAAAAAHHAQQASYNQNYESPTSISTYKSKPLPADTGPRPGTQAWHDQRKLTQPDTYYQNQY